jgi:hypothetical protein
MKFDTYSCLPWPSIAMSFTHVDEYIRIMDWCTDRKFDILVAMHKDYDLRPELRKDIIYMIFFRNDRDLTELMLKFGSPNIIVHRAYEVNYKHPQFQIIETELAPLAL